MIPRESREVDIDSGEPSSHEPHLTANSGTHVMPVNSLSLTREELTTLVARLKVELKNREQEILQLRERLSIYEPHAAPDPLGVECSRVGALTAAPDKPPAPFAATPSGDSQAYPTIQRLALSFGFCSLFPPPGHSVPPSQRRSPRRMCEIELEFAEDTQFYAGLTQDISQGGMFIATYKLLPIGSTLALEFDLPNGTHVRTRGEVKWLREAGSSSARPGMGIAFTEIEDKALEAIADFCRERPPLYMEV